MIPQDNKDYTIWDLGRRLDVCFVFSPPCILYIKAKMPDFAYLWRQRVSYLAPLKDAAQNTPLVDQLVINFCECYQFVLQTQAPSLSFVTNVYNIPLYTYLKIYLLLSHIHPCFICLALAYAFCLIYLSACPCPPPILMPEYLSSSFVSPEWIALS